MLHVDNNRAPASPHLRGQVLRHPGLGWLGFRMRNVDLFRENLANAIDQRDALLGGGGGIQTAGRMSG